MAPARRRLVSARRARSGQRDYEAIVRQRYAKLSPAHRKVADYLLADGRRAALEPIATVAPALRTSESTVVRLPQALGFKEYPDLRDGLRARSLATPTSPDRVAPRASATTAT